MTPERFWQLSYGELVDILQSSSRLLERERKKTITDNLMLAGMVSRYFGMKKGETPPMPWDYAPDLFEAERKRYEADRMDQATETVRNSRKAFAARKNARVGGGE